LSVGIVYKTYIGADALRARLEMRSMI
jgi:hypothetical protein